MKDEEGSGLSLRHFVTHFITGRPNANSHCNKTVKFEVIHVCVILLYPCNAVRWLEMVYIRQAYAFKFFRLIFLIQFLSGFH
jgi:hypothetical protein